MPTSLSMATEASGEGKIPALTESKFARFSAIIMLYFMQGVPVGLSLIAIVPWLAASGASPVAVGAFAGTALLPWSLKLFGGLLMDRFTYRPMGRRRVWIIIAQSLMVFILIAMAIASPAASQVGLLAGFCFALNLCAILNDVATDGMTVDLVPHEERTTINGMMFAAQWLGVAVTGFLAGQLLAMERMSTLTLVLAALVAAVSITIALLRERPGERLMPWTEGQASTECEARQQEAWLPILKGIFSNLFVPSTLLFLFAVGLAQATDGFTDALAPTLAVQELGFSSDAYSRFASVAAFFCGVSGALAAPMLVKLLGLRTALFSVLIGLASVTAFAGLTFSSWQSANIFMFVTSAQFFLTTTVTVIAVVWAMRICDPVVAASLFSLFMAVPNFSRSMMSGSSGWVFESVGYSGAYFTVAAISLLSLVVHVLAKTGVTPSDT